MSDPSKPRRSSSGESPSPGTGSAGRSAPPLTYQTDQDVHILDRLAVLYRYRRVAGVVFVLTTIALMIQGYSNVRLFQAQARILIEDERSTAMPGISENAYYEDPAAVLPDAVPDSEGPRSDSARRQADQARRGPRVQRDGDAALDAVGRHSQRAVARGRPAAPGSPRDRARGPEGGRDSGRIGPRQRLPLTRRSHPRAGQPPGRRHVHVDQPAARRRTPSTPSSTSTWRRTSRSSCRAPRTCSTGSRRKCGLSSRRSRTANVSSRTTATARTPCRSTTRTTSWSRG